MWLQLYFYLLVISASYFSGNKFETSVFDAQIATIGNTGFLGILSWPPYWPAVSWLCYDDPSNRFCNLCTLIVVLIMVSGTEMGNRIIKTYY